MATYVNNLRLTELATGEGSGTWGTTTNTNLELIGEALGYGSEAVANASTHTITVADGTADSARSFYLKLTGGGQACTVTLAPNTLSKVWMVENTTNSTLTFSQGSGANVAVPAGQVKMIATDGAGSGAVVYDLLVDTDLTGTTTVVNLTSSGTIDAATVEFNSLSGTGSVAITDILDQDNMSSDSATALATQQSIKAYVDSSVASFDTLAEVLAQGNTTGSTDIEVTTAQKVQFRDSAIYINSSADGQLDIVADTEIQITATTLDANGNLDVSGTIAAGGVVTANAGVVVDTMTLDGSTLTSTGDFIVDAAADIIFDADANDVLFKDGGTEYFRITNNGTSTVKLDAVGDIILDADGGDIYLDDGGTGFGQISGASSNLTIKSSTADKDMIFQGNDGGSAITALTLDMSDAGTALFNNHVSISDDSQLRFGAGNDATISHNSSNNNFQITNSNTSGGMVIQNNGSVGGIALQPVINENAVFCSPNAQVILYHNGVAKFETTSGGIEVTGDITNDSGDLTLDVAGDIILDAGGAQIRFHDDGADIGVISNESNNLIIKSQVSDADLIFKGNDGGSSVTALTLDMSAAGTAIFNHDIEMADAALLRIGAGGDFIATSDGSNALLYSNNGNFVIDSAGEIYLDADGGDIIFQDGGAEFGRISKTGSNLTLDVAGEIVLDADTNGVVRINDAGSNFGAFFKNGTTFTLKSEISDYDMVFSGNDGGATINALTLDMSAAGLATFNDDVVADAFLPTTSGAYGSNHVGVHSSGVVLNAATSQTGYIMSAGSAAMTFGPTGSTIQLGGLTTANALDDYEEGTFTPTFIGSTGNPTVNYNTQLGSYTKIGNTVTYTIFIVTNSRSGGSGHLSVGGLPFTVGLNQDYGSTIGFNYNWVSGEYPQHAIAQNGQTHVLLYKDGSSNTPSNPDDILASGNSYLRLTGFYYTTA